MTTVADLHRTVAAGGEVSWRHAFAAQHHRTFAEHSEPPLAHCVNAWMDARQALAWALRVSDQDAHAAGVLDRRELALAASEAVALGARQLARHHDHTLLHQLGYTVAQVRRIRAWAAGSEQDLAAAVDRAGKAGRVLHAAELPGPAAVADLPAMLGHGVTVPGEPTGG